MWRVSMACSPSILGMYINERSRKVDGRERVGRSERREGGEDLPMLDGWKLFWEGRGRVVVGVAKEKKRKGERDGRARESGRRLLRRQIPAAAKGERRREDSPARGSQRQFSVEGGVVKIIWADQLMEN